MIKFLLLFNVPSLFTRFENMQRENTVLLFFCVSSSYSHQRNKLNFNENKKLLAGDYKRHYRS